MRSWNSRLTASVADASAEEIAIGDSRIGDVRRTQVLMMLARHEIHTHIFLHRLRDFESIDMISIAADNRDAIEMIVSATIDQIDRKRYIDAFFFIYIKKMPSVHVSRWDLWV